MARSQAGPALPLRCPRQSASFASLPSQKALRASPSAGPQGKQDRQGKRSSGRLKPAPTNLPASLGRLGTSSGRRYMIGRSSGRLPRQGPFGEALPSLRSLPRKRSGQAFRQGLRASGTSEACRYKPAGVKPALHDGTCGRGRNRYPKFALWDSLHRDGASDTLGGTCGALNDAGSGRREAVSQQGEKVGRPEVWKSRRQDRPPSVGHRIERN